MGQIILRIVAIILVAIGVVCIFDARVITKKIFSFGDQNEGSLGLKMLGFIIAMIGALMFYFVIGK
ncbi:MAG: hypothetical protein HFJ25_04930 [Clostridia bacterium]|nr:hypothetical protein [Clostridia bacterium]